MNDATIFTKKEIQLIKNKIDEKYNRALAITILFFVPCSFAYPFIPGRRSGRRPIEYMGYAEAVTFFAFIFFAILLVVVIGNFFKIERQLKKTRPFFRRKKMKGTVLKKNIHPIPIFKNKVLTNLSEPYKSVAIDKKTFRKIKVGDCLMLEIEENTKTILKLDVVKNSIL